MQIDERHLTKGVLVNKQIIEKLNQKNDYPSEEWKEREKHVTVWKRNAANRTIRSLPLWKGDETYEVSK